MRVTLFPFPAPFAGEMQGESRFADAALLVEERGRSSRPLRGYPPIGAVPNFRRVRVS